MSEPLDLALALDAIVASLAAQFDTFKTVAAEDEARGNLKLPAIIVQMSEIEPELDRDPETGQFPGLVRVEVRIVMGKRTPQVRRQSINAAAAVAAFAHKERFGVLWGPASIAAVEPDEFSPVADQFDVWRVEWGHSADFGTSYFVDEGETPTMVLASFVPEIGEPNEGAYVRVAGDV